MENQDEKLKELEKTYKGVIMSEMQLMRVRRSIEKAKREKRQIRRNLLIKRSASLAAAVVIAFIVLPNTSQRVAYAMSRIPIIGNLVEVVTVRDYQYDGERNFADVKVPELVLQSGEGTGEEKGDTTLVVSTAKQTAEEINAEIKEITEKLVSEFEDNLDEEWGYQDILVDSQVLNTTERYFTLKLICYQGAGSGAEWDYYYTIDLTNGQRLALEDLFIDGADYKERISENIKEQMREQMAQDENKFYWLDDEDIPEWNFQSITDETAFYLNERDNVVICFNEGDVAPMYMGCVQFEIPDEIINDIRSER